MQLLHCLTAMLWPTLIVSLDTSAGGFRTLSAGDSHIT